MSGKFYSFSVVLIWLNISLSSCEQLKDDAECFVPGECLDSTVLVVLQDSSFNDCLADCKEYVADNGATCQDFTFYILEQACVLYEDCESLETTDCSDCLSGNVDCDDFPCFLEGLGCQGTDIDNDIGLTSPQECLDACAQTEDCMWATYYSDTQFCVLTSDCEDLFECADCTTSNVNNPECQTDDVPGNNDVLLIIGGYDNSRLSSVEAIDFGGGSCNGQLTPLPEANDFNPCIRNAEGAPLSCGGNQASDPTACVTLTKGGLFDQWVTGPFMNFPREVGSQGVELSDGRFLVTSSTTATTTIEILEEDGVFDIGPSELSTNFETCAFELFPGTILISGGAVDQDSIFLLDVETGLSTELPLMPNGRRRHACGKVVNGAGEVEVVMAGGFSLPTSASSDILNLEAMTWRPGPFLPTELEGATSSPFGDTFLIAGGRNDSSLYQSAILEYNPIRESWITREEELEVARTFHGAVWVDRNAVSC